MSLFSYPDGQKGSFDAISRACLRDGGVKLGFSFYGGRQRGALDPLDVRRTGVSHEAGRALFRARATLPRLFARDTARNRDPREEGSGDPGAG